MAIDGNSITFCMAWYLFRSDTDSLLSFVKSILHSESLLSTGLMDSMTTPEFEFGNKTTGVQISYAFIAETRLLYSESAQLILKVFLSVTREQVNKFNRRYGMTYD